MTYNFENNTENMENINMENLNLMNDENLNTEFEVPIPLPDSPVSPQSNDDHFDAIPMEILEETKKFASSPVRKTRKALRDEANGVKPAASSYGPIKKPREKNKAKHNESEAKRRSRLRDKFFELRDAAKVAKKDRYNILTTAISRLQEFEDRIAELEEEKAALLTKSGSCSENTVTSAPTSPSSSPADAIHTPALANIACATVALDGRLQDCNSAFSQLTGYQSDQLATASLFSLSHPLDMGETFTIVKKLLSGELRAWDANRNLIDAKGQSIPAHLTLTTITLNNSPSHYLLMLLPKPMSAQVSNQVQFANAVVVGTAAAVGLGLSAANVAASTPFKNKEAASSFPAFDAFNLDMQAF
jgi:PAS domain S-box-containing protein